ncbi:hypothetical protein N0V93_008586 [Gnomoniopsis smithogilvyi]|uniref:Uncharacterized protein n=1 Tax=Gnomoniopsis smithogilvyi TaxID=1191159 RepID=A0A9W8YPG0_9PEZI|nr:hypothetical protein N0V93_008586 [Gnomoniopsis smithogilvyi]
MADSGFHPSNQPRDDASKENVFRTFERSLPENCVEYMLFILGADLEPKQSFSSLEAVRKTAVQLSTKLTKDYIWQREGFNLEIKSTDGLQCLYGITDYGDCVEDEWLIVYIVRELTKQFSNVWARVSDSDGEFLLVEAANVLPKWLSPENDANRAWLHAGQLHIIPRQPVSDVPSNKVTLAQAVRVLRSSPDTLVHSPLIEAEAFYRLEKYPSQIQESIHHAMVTIPRQIAHVLHELPRAIAPATEAFYLRDPMSLKPLMSTSADHLTFPPTDLVDVSVRFTKVLYAQLKSQQFSPPPAWRPLVASLEENTALGSSETAQKKHSMIDLGMKITCGFEMLAVGAAHSNDRITRELALLLEDLAEDGPSALPSDADISSWRDHARHDDDSWMDINFEDFEKELDGKGGSTKDKSFGDTNTQADLRKIVSRFEAFLNDEKAGIDGAELDDMDEDDDDSESGDESEGEDREVSFDEEEFARMMHEMMGLPTGNASERKGDQKKIPSPYPNSDPDPAAVKEDSEDEEIRQLSEQMAAELREHGALQLDPTPKKGKALNEKGKGRMVETPAREADEVAIEGESEDEEVDIDYNLAKNLLESFKGQAGLMGPVGTMLADMGIQLPRDEDDEDDA